MPMKNPEPTYRCMNCHKVFRPQMPGMRHHSTPAQLARATKRLPVKAKLFCCAECAEQFKTTPAYYFLVMYSLLDTYTSKKNSEELIAKFILGEYAKQYTVDKLFDALNSYLEFVEVPKKTSLPSLIVTAGGEVTDYSPSADSAFFDIPEAVFQQITKQYEVFCREFWPKIQEAEDVDFRCTYFVEGKLQELTGVADES